MPVLDLEGGLSDAWTVLAEGQPVPAEGAVLLDPARFAEAEGRNAPTGVVIEGATPHDRLPALADRAAAIAIRFPLFRDGRGFTLVRHLRERLGYAGPIIATGHVLPDQWYHLRQLGASGVILAEGADPALWHAAGTRFAAPYQAALTGHRA